MPVVVSIEGNIGAGKTTLLEALVPRVFAPDAVALVPEPVEHWQASGVLGLFYEEPRRWAYSFQSYAFLSRLRAQVSAVRAPPAPAIVLERSVWSDRHVFAAHCRATGLFAEPAEGIMYDDWHDWLMDEAFGTETRLDGIVYVRSSPPVCLERIQRRARSEEAVIPLAYLSDLHARHEAWLQRAEAPVLTIDGDTLCWEDPQAVDALGARLRAFVGGLSRTI